MGKNLGEAALKRYQAKGKNGYIRVWKTVKKRNGHYESDWMGYRYKAGFTHAQKSALNEQGLIHAFRDKESAKRWYSPWEIIVECFVKPNWVTAVGKGFSDKLSLTTKAIVMPKFPATKVTVREFREAVKGKKVKKYKWEQP